MSKPMRVLRSSPEIYNKQYRKRRRIKIICAVVFGIAALTLVSTSLVSMIYDIRNEGVNTVTSSEYNTEEIIYSKEDDFNMLVLGLGADDTSLEYATVIGFSPSVDSVKVTTFSDYTAVSSINNGEALGQIYAKSGKSGAVSMIEKICGINIDGTAVFDFYGTVNFLNLFDGAAVNLDQDISYSPSDSIMGIIASKGKRKFSGRELIRLFLFRGWENGEADRTRFISRTFASVVDKNLSGGLKDQYDTLYTRITNTVSTDVTATVYSEISDRIFYLAKKNENGDGLCLILEVKGDYDSSNKKYTVSSGTVQGIRNYFKV